MPSGTYLGLDFGLKRLGVAVGQSVTGSARPLTTLACRGGEPDWSAFQVLLDEWRPDALVVGIPRHADGTASTTTAQAEAFTNRLRRVTGLTVHRVDESLSSHEAAKRLRDSGRPVRSKRDKAILDQVAAQVILETWFGERNR
ncbi:MAG: Holliday junction resolvase RuvX [Ectothiorhodospiraceae bacterium]|jgi:putative Holliday junction resolvase